jgi:hypothetical protein
MPDDLAKLRPADADDLRRSLAYALRFNGRRARFRQADELMAEITADHLAKHLERCGYVIMRKPPIGDFARIAQGPKPEG